VIFSPNRYWKVDGIRYNLFLASAKIDYNGSASLNGGFLDNDLFSGSESALTVYYRASSADEWAEVNSVSQDTQGSSTDRRGNFIINNLQFGEYTLAFVDMNRTDPISTSNPECILTDIEGESLQQNTYFQLFPNPASKQNDLLTLRFLKSNNNKKTIRVYQTNGQLLQEEMVTQGTEAHSISLQNWSNGVYLLQVFEGERLMGVERFFVVD